MFEDNFRAFRVETGIADGVGNDQQVIERVNFALALAKVEEIFAIARAHHRDPNSDFGKFPPDYVVFHGILKNPPLITDHHDLIKVTSNGIDRLLVKHQQDCHSWEEGTLCIDRGAVKIYYDSQKGSIQCAPFNMEDFLDSRIDIEPLIKRDLTRGLEELTSNCRIAVAAG